MNHMRISGTGPSSVILSQTCSLKYMIYIMKNICRVLNQEVFGGSLWEPALAWETCRTSVYGMITAAEVATSPGT